MNTNEIKKIISYWIATARHDYETMNSLFKNRRYSDSLFFAHIVLEKVLKAHAVEVLKKQARYTHNLVLLAEDAKLLLSEEEWNLLAEVNRFNIRTRYPDEKLQFYKQCTKAYTQDYLTKIKKLHNNLCLKLRKNKLKE